MTTTLAHILRSDRVILRPLVEGDRDALYAVASDPLIWEQHPQHDRHLRSVFDTFVDGALEHGTAYVIIDAATQAIIGSTRFYEPAQDGSYIYIGFTFFARAYWGTGLNHHVKHLMLEHAFATYPEVRFQIGIHNRRSRIAIERLGATLIGEVDLSDPGTTASPHVVYALRRQ
jgi:N-acetyltransferase